MFIHTLMFCSHGENNWKFPMKNKNQLHAVCTREFSGLLCLSKRNSTLNHKLTWRERTFSLEGPIQHTHWSQKGGLYAPLPPMPPISFPCAFVVGLPWSLRGNGWRHEMICSSQRKGSSLTSGLFHTEQKANVKLKPRGRCLVGWEQLR